MSLIYESFNLFIIIKRLRPVYKPHSVHGAEAPLGSHLSGRRVATSLGAAYPGLAFPTRGKGTCEDEPSPIVHRQFRPCLALPPAGVPWPHALLRAPVVSYPTFSPSPPPPAPEGWRGGCLFLWPVSGRFAPFSGSPPRLLSDAVLFGVRTF